LKVPFIRAIQNGDQRWLHAATRLILFELWHKSFDAGAIGLTNSRYLTHWLCEITTEQIRAEEDTNELS
jgi:hypothetical protein